MMKKRCVMVLTLTLLLCASFSAYAEDAAAKATFGFKTYIRHVGEKELPVQDFVFDIVPVDEYDDTMLSFNDGHPVDEPFTVTVRGDRTYDDILTEFDLTIYKAGDYKFRVSQKTDNVPDYWHYETNVYTVTIPVSENTDGSLTVGLIKYVKEYFGDVLSVPPTFINDSDSSGYFYAEKVWTNYNGEQDVPLKLYYRVQSWDAESEEYSYGPWNEYTGSYEVELTKPEEAELGSKTIWEIRIYNLPAFINNEIVGYGVAEVGLDGSYTVTYKDVDGNLITADSNGLRIMTHGGAITNTLEVTNGTVTWVDEDGTVLETDENVPYGTTPTYDGTTPTKEATAQNTYTFAGWEPAVSVVTGDVTYKATYTSSTNTYTVIWQNEDGTVLETDEGVAYGATPAYDGQTPTKAADAQNTYTFAGWEPAVSAVTGDVIYKATYTSSTNTYTVIWQNEDGTVLETDEGVAYGATPSYDGQTPTKAADAQNTYTFAGWEPAVSAVTGDATYKAAFTSTAKTYIVTFAPNGGSGTMASQTFTAGVAQDLTLNTFTREGFTFTGWNTAADGSGTSFADGASVTASSNATLYAQWKAAPAATPLAITKQPTDQFVVEGQRAEFSVEATGDGLTYQWYINRNDGKGWRELDGAIGTAYVTSVTGLECDGFQYGCLITDQHGNTLKSDVAVLHVSKVPALPETGDSSTPMLWLAMSLLSMAGILLLRKKAYSR